MICVPLDIKAETLLSYLPRDKRTIELKGSHKRNAYEDIADINVDEHGIFNIGISRNGIYDILPECLFHPIDRFDNIPANEYKERFKAECEQQQIEEDNARRYFQPLDNVLMELSSVITESKNNEAYTQILENIVCDNLSESYCNNRFVKKAKEYMPMCRNIRGNKSLLSLMIRHILLDEHIKIYDSQIQNQIKDPMPRYNSRLDDEVSADNEFFLGNEFDEDMTVYNIHYWNEDECGQDFLSFVNDMGVFEDFLNDYFIGIESRLKFKISATSLPVILSDDDFYTFLGYNTNI